MIFVIPLSFNIIFSSLFVFLISSSVLKCLEGNVAFCCILSLLQSSCFSYVELTFGLTAHKQTLSTAIIKIKIVGI